MAYQKKMWKDRLTQYPNRRTLTDTTTGTTQTVDVARAEGEVGETGDAFSEENMNAMETRIDNAFKDKVITKYGTCSTAAATAAKEATLVNKDDWKLVAGAQITICFTNNVPASATLNVESSGAKAIYFHGAALIADIINAGDTATFIYDGTNYVLTSLDAGTGGGGGHEILDASGTAMAQEARLQFKGGLSVTDDSTNGKTVVDGDYEVIDWEDWLDIVEAEEEALHPNAVITNAPNPSGDGVQTFAIATTDWTANSGTDATEFPYVCNVITSSFTDDFVPAEVLLLGATASIYPTSADETAISLVDKYIKFSTSGIRLRATDAPASALTLIVRGAIAAPNGLITAADKCMLSDNTTSVEDCLVASNDVPFRFGYDSTSGKYGYIVQNGGADTFVPFKNGEIDFNKTENTTTLGVSAGTQKEISGFTVGHNYMLVCYDSSGANITGNYMTGVSEKLFDKKIIGGNSGVQITLTHFIPSDTTIGIRPIWGTSYASSYYTGAARGWYIDLDE